MYVYTCVYKFVCVVSGLGVYVSVHFNMFSIFRKHTLVKQVEQQLVPPMHVLEYSEWHNTEIADNA